MNKALHGLVYVFLALAAAALWFELQLNAKRSLLTDRNRQQEDYFVKVASQIEKAEPDKGITVEPINMDASPVEAREIDSPDMENVLDGYNAYLETANLDTYKWNDSERSQLRAIYVLDEEGKPVMDLGQPKMEGPGTSKELLEKLLDSAKAQLARLNLTRAELVTLRGKLANAVAEVNRLKPIARKDKVDLLEKQERISALEEDKSSLENQLAKVKAQVDELNTEITSLKDEVTTAKDEHEATKEELAKSQKLVEHLKQLVQESIQNQSTAASQGNAAVTTLPAGDKGTIVHADNNGMFAVIRLTDEAVKELKGENGDRPIPSLELAVRRAGFRGAAGEFVGRIKLRQEVKGKSLVICDILDSWSQAPLQANDTVFAD